MYMSTPECLAYTTGHQRSIMSTEGDFKYDIKESINNKIKLVQY